MFRYIYYIWKGVYQVQYLGTIIVYKQMKKAQQIIWIYFLIYI